MTYPAIFGLFVVLFVFFRCFNCSTPVDHWPRAIRAALRLIAATGLVATLVTTSLSIAAAVDELRPVGEDIIRLFR